MYILFCRKCVHYSLSSYFSADQDVVPEPADERQAAAARGGRRPSVPAAHRRRRHLPADGTRDLPAAVPSSGGGAGHAEHAASPRFHWCAGAWTREGADIFAYGHVPAEQYITPPHVTLATWEWRHEYPAHGQHELSRIHERSIHSAYELFRQNEIAEGHAPELALRFPSTWPYCRTDPRNPSRTLSGFPWISGACYDVNRSPLVSLSICWTPILAEFMYIQM